MTQGTKVYCDLFAGVWVVTHVFPRGLYEIRQGEVSTHVLGRRLRSLGVSHG